MNLTSPASGILLHPTSLPGPYGIGEIGEQARQWVKVLEETGQRVWQFLPLGPTGYGDSPYQSFSTFAGNPLWIALDDLLRDGLLDLRDLESFPVLDPVRVEFGPVLEARRKILGLACARFRGRRGRVFRGEAARWIRREAFWLEEFSLFMALKTEQGGRPWPDWPAALRDRDPGALADARIRLQREIEAARIEQFLFDRQWKKLRAHARRAKVLLFGDVPMFVAHDSADVWANPNLFQLDPAGQPTAVAGVPPDYFSETGQRWGNPLYRWDRHAESGYDWWIRRMRRTFEMMDLARLDHFRGVEAGWEIPASEPVATRGRWQPGPGGDLLRAIRKSCPDLEIVAEDLGVITPPVEKLRRAFRLPGMRVLQFLFGDDLTASSAARKTGPDRVVYTGTHDNDTTVGWFAAPPGTDSRPAAEVEAERDRARRALGSDGREIHWDMIRFAFRTRARLAVIPLQDVMGLDSRARMNRPGTGQGNWNWRFAWEQFAPALRLRLRTLTEQTARCAAPRKAGRRTIRNVRRQSAVKKTKTQPGRRGR